MKEYHSEKCGWRMGVDVGGTQIEIKFTPRAMVH